jgi:hypothetical protein
MGIAFNTELRRIIWPPRLTNRVAQPPNRFRREFNKGSQVAPLRTLAPTGSPKYLKGTAPVLELRKTEASRIKSADTFTPIILLFPKFTLRPENHFKSSQNSLQTP